MQIGSGHPEDTQPPPPVQSQVPPIPTGFWAGVGKRAFGWALAHQAPPSLDNEKFEVLHPQCSSLIVDISNQVVTTLLKESKNSAFVAGGSEQLKNTMIEIIEHIFVSLGGDKAGIGDEELTDRVLAKIIGTIRSEFMNVEASPKRHFKNIAHRLFEDAFPGGINNPSIPKLLKDDKASKIARYGIAKVVGVDVSWNGVKKLLAQYLEKTYNAVIQTEGLKLDEERLPGADAFIDDMVLKIDAKTKDTSSLSLNIPLEGEKNKEFVNRSIVRILQGKCTREEDAEQLGIARAWLLEHMKTAMKAIYNTIFSPKDGQTQDDRLNEFADRIVSRAAEILPHAEELGVVVAITRIVKDDIDPNKLQPLLPDFLPAQTALTKVYELAAPFVSDLIKQSEIIQKEGAEATKELTQHDDGKKIAGLVDSGINALWDFLETKAKANTLQLTGYEFIDRLICHILLPTTLDRNPRVKHFINAQIKNIISIVIKRAIGTEGLKNPEKALADITNTIIAQGQEVVVALLDAKKTPQACQELARELSIALEAADTNDEKLEATFDRLYLIKASRQILHGVLSEESFNNLLPEFLKKSDLWKAGAEMLANKVFKGLYTQTKQIKAVTGPQFSLPPELSPLVQSLHESIVENIKSTENSNESFQSKILKSPGVLRFVENALPKILESCIAYHVHPTDTHTSDQKTANLLLTIATSAQAGFDKVAALSSDGSSYGNWLKTVDPNDLDLYRKKYDIPADEPINPRAFILRQTSQEVIVHLLPPELLKTLIPPEFAGLNIDQILASTFYSYIDMAYDYSRAMANLQTSDADLNGLQAFIVDKLKKHFVEIPDDKKTWIEKVAGRIFLQANDKVMGFVLNFGAIGLLLKNAAGPDNKELRLLSVLSPIAKTAQGVLAVLNEPSSQSTRQKLDEILKTEQKDLLAYKAVTGKEVAEGAAGNDLAQFAYWLLARRALDSIADDEWSKAIPVFNKDAAASLVMKLYETIHITQAVLVAKESEGERLVDEIPDLTSFVDEYLVKNFRELLVDLGSQDERLTKTLPTILDALIKDFFKDAGLEVGTVGEIRDTVLHRVVYTAMGKLLTDDKPVLLKVKELVESYNKGDDKATGALLIEHIMPAEVGATPVGKALLNEAIPTALAMLIDDIHISQKKILEKGREAKAYVDGLDDGSMKSFVQQMLSGLDESLDLQAQDPQKLSLIFPAYIDKVVKDILLDDTLNPIIKEMLHNAVYIVLQQVLTPKPNQTVQDRVLEVSGQLLAFYQSNNPKKTGAEWLNLLLPKDTLKELLPEFLQKAVTHEKLIEWFFEPYVGQFYTVFENTAAEIEKNKKEVTNNVKRAQKIAKNSLLDYTKPTAPEKGLFGFGGVMRDIEKKILETLKAENIESGANYDLAGAMQTYLDAAVGKITRTLEVQGKLESQFLSKALTFSLANSSSQEFKIPDDGEFSQKAAEALLLMLFPNGKADLPVADVLKNLVWDKVSVAIGGVVTELTAPDSRTLWLIDRLIPMASAEETKNISRQRQVEELRSRLIDGKLDSRDNKAAEALFKTCMIETAVRKAETAVQKENLWGPFKWIKTMVVKALTYLTLRYSLQNRIYSFISNPESDQAIRRIIWSFLIFNPRATQPDDQADLQIANGLKKELTSAFKRINIAPAVLCSPFASLVQSALEKQNIIDLMSDEEAIK